MPNGEDTQENKSPYAEIRHSVLSGLSLPHLPSSSPAPALLISEFPHFGTLPHGTPQLQRESNWEHNQSPGISENPGKEAAEERGVLRPEYMKIKHFPPHLTWTLFLLG